MDAAGLVSIHVPLAEHDHRDCSGRPRLEVSIHVPLAEHDVYNRPGTPESGVSIHVPLAEHDNAKAAACTRRSSFNSRAPRGARRVVEGEIDAATLVSIHVPLAEHDGTTADHLDHAPRFNSRAPRGARPWMMRGSI